MPELDYVFISYLIFSENQTKWPMKYFSTLHYNHFTLAIGVQSFQQIDNLQHIYTHTPSGF